MTRTASYFPLHELRLTKFIASVPDSQAPRELRHLPNGGVWELCLSACRAGRDAGQGRGAHYLKCQECGCPGQLARATQPASGQHYQLIAVGVQETPAQLKLANLLARPQSAPLLTESSISRWNQNGKPPGQCEHLTVGNTNN